MRNLLAFLAAAVLTFGIVGWCLDWYRFRSVPSEDGKPSLTVDFNPKKVAEDFKKAQAAIEKKLAERAAKLEEQRKAAEEKKLEEKAVGEFRPDIEIDTAFSSD